MRKPTEEQLLTILREIESRKISVTLDQVASAEAISRENGIYHFDTPDKWRIGVFVDCGKFDYIDYLQHGGTRIGYNQLCRYYPKVEVYANRFRDSEATKEIWGIEAKIFAGL